MIKLDEEEKQAKNDDELFRIPENHLNIRDTYEKKSLLSKLKDLMPLLHIVTGLLVVIVGIIAVLSWINMSALSAEITDLRAKMNSVDTAGMKSQLAAVESKMENMKKEDEKFRADMSQLNNEVHTLKGKIEKLEAAGQKQQPAAKKKPADKPPKTKPVH
jgi:septal ring factor EnvC (AmiA/AmiB activator)